MGRNLNVHLARIFATQERQVVLGQGLDARLEHRFLVLDLAALDQRRQLLPKFAHVLVALKDKVPLVPQLLEQDVNQVAGRRRGLVLVQGQDAHRDDAALGVEQVQHNLDGVITNQVVVDVEAALAGQTGQGCALVLGLVVEGGVEAELLGQESHLLVGARRANDAQALALGELAGQLAQGSGLVEEMVG